jgi:hypothetical protein
MKDDNADANRSNYHARRASFFSDAVPMMHNPDGDEGVEVQWLYCDLLC